MTSNICQRLRKIKKGIPDLTDPVTPVLGLFVVVRVEVEIVEDDGVGGRQVDAQTSGSSRKNEHKNAVVSIELVD